MPLYSYRCDTCSEEHDHLQKFSDPLIDLCPACGSAQYARTVTLPNGKVRACASAEALGISLPSEEQVAKTRAEKDANLPWWRSGKVEGLPKKDKPINLNKVADIQKYVETGEVK